MQALLKRDTFIKLSFIEEYYPVKLSAIQKRVYSN